MERRYLDIRSVAVIGAGVSGVAAAIHLRKAGLNVTVFERGARAGGVWYDIQDESSKFLSADPYLPKKGLRRACCE